MDSAGRFHAVRLMPGQNLTDGLRAACPGSGAVVTCVGSLSRVAIRHADRDAATVYEGRFEIVSLTGTIGPDGQHLHIAIADGAGQVRGGHLMAEGSAIYTTAEIVLVRLTDLRFGRADCPVSGFRELVVTPAGADAP